MSQRSKRPDPKERRESSLQTFAHFRNERETGPSWLSQNWVQGKKLKQTLRANYSEDEITKIGITLEYVILDFFNRFMDVALAKWVQATA